ncbi:hypothetical protein D9758_010314 [Tetrapyrgos nigripes]|uniref:Xylose isomerase-like TIM barrel domain-containing protein n=1 Tax=Tetrapyrgos nigripes TaxID=182062 RepID=A0A8H5GA60_9AGAR|nr:hypothetical protein D9758_010314 [Tetrapyrgos nigripes]
MLVFRLGPRPSFLNPSLCFLRITMSGKPSNATVVMTLKRNISAVVEEEETQPRASSLRRSTRAKKAKLAVGTSQETEMEMEMDPETSASSSKPKEKPPKAKRKAMSPEDVDEDTDSNYEPLCKLRVWTSLPWKVGAHVSAAGGVENSVTNAARIGANAFALFVKSQRKWESPPLKPESVASFKDNMKVLGYEAKYVLPHGSYLINLGNPDEEKREKSYQCFLDDLKRCEELGLELYNFHPGSTLGQVEPSVSIKHIADCINRAHKETPGSRVCVVLENMVVPIPVLSATSLTFPYSSPFPFPLSCPLSLSVFRPTHQPSFLFAHFASQRQAGAGNVIGSSFSELGQIISQVEDKTRVGACLDTCHMFAAGYDIRTKEGWENTMQTFDRDVGLKYLCGMHLNDSQTPCGSRRDRHENVGIGHLSLHTFSHILTDARTQDIPLILETPCYEDAEKKGGIEKHEIWRKEVGVLNRLSLSNRQSLSTGTFGVSGISSSGTKGEVGGKEEGGEEEERIETLVEEIREVVGRAKAGAGSAKQKGKKSTEKAKGMGTGKMKGKGKASKTRDEDEEVDE